MPHIPKIEGNPLGKPYIYDNQNKKPENNDNNKHHNKKVGNKQLSLSQNRIFYNAYYWGEKHKESKSEDPKNAALLLYHWPDHLCSSSHKTSK